MRLVCLLFLLTTMPVFAQDAAATRALHALFDREWDYTMQQHPTHASSLGDRRWNDRWEDDSLAAIDARYQHTLAVIGELKRIDRAQLPSNDQTNYDLFLRQHQLAADGHKFHWYLIPLNQRGGIQTADELGDALRFTTVKDYEDWIARLQRFPEHMDQNIALMREGIAEKMLLPKVIMQRIPGQIEKQIVDDPAKSLFYKPFMHFPQSISAADRERLSAAAKKAIAEQLVPAFKKFHEFFVKDYLPACPEEIGIWKLPHGDEMYAYFVREYTTTNMTPQQVHEAGLAEVKRIRAEMDAAIAATGFKGDMGAFVAMLRKDPRFYATSREDLLEKAALIVSRIDDKLPRYFGTLPRLPLAVRPVPAEIEDSYTTGRYFEGSPKQGIAGGYMVNTSHLDQRPLYELPALTLHEGVPGHHIQIALAQELQGVPSFRRNADVTAFTEGWGLYAEQLGAEMGVYRDPYEQFGRLSYEMWRACRLVADTGIHWLGWSLDQARECFTENTALSPLNIEVELARYVGWPGQALAYKVGELKIMALRRKAEAALGPRFDIRRFHDAVLLAGPLPLDLLERRIDAWIRMEER
jgi:uncharacterized protein (DUF885 family)